MFSDDYWLSTQRRVIGIPPQGEPGVLHFVRQASPQDIDGVQLQLQHSDRHDAAALHQFRLLLGHRIPIEDEPAATGNVV